jgi:SM-20-related protein
MSTYPSLDRQTSTQNRPSDLLTPPRNSGSIPEEITVTILLEGGHQYSLPIPSNAPLLQQLFALVVEPPANRTQKLFQIPIDQGRSVLCFAGSQLIGLVTTPPIVLQQQPDSGSPSDPVVQPVKSNTQSFDPTVLPSDYVQLDHFLTFAEQQRLLDFVNRQEAAFVSTNTSTGDLEYRKSVVLHSFPEFADLICQRIQMVLPDIFAQLGMTAFPIAQIESQLTGHNDGNYYKVHNDNGSPDTATREFTYVYYFYREPKAFSGGELLIYDSKIENNFYVQAESYRAIEPRNNSIVFFPSRYMHEVLPICCPSRLFRDSRFTINGWIRR